MCVRRTTLARARPRPLRCLPLSSPLVHRLPDDLIRRTSARLASWRQVTQRRRYLENSAVPTLLTRAAHDLPLCYYARAEGDLEACWNGIPATPQTRLERYASAGARPKMTGNR